MDKDKIIEICAWVVIVIFIGTLIIVAIKKGYDPKCVDNIAKEVCISKNYQYGKASRAPLGNLGDTPHIQCYSDERDLDYDSYRFLDGELDKCKK